METFDIVIVGGGVAGATAAARYRQVGGTGTVAIISADRNPPVNRPPLSKDYLRGDTALEAVFVHPLQFYEDKGINLRLATPVDALDLATKQIELADGGRIGFGTLVLATGAHPRHLSIPGSDLQGIHYLRSLSSSEQLRTDSQSARHAVIIGAGFIGMEVASSLTQRGVHCTVVEVGPRIWPTLVPDTVAAFVQSCYTNKGVDFRFGHKVVALEGDTRVQSVVLDDGETLPADLVVAGIGAILNTKLAEDAGLAVDHGVQVDTYLRTTHADVYAIGDIANFPDPVIGHVHVEHFDSAIDQGNAVGRTLAGHPTSFNEVASFYSDIFDLTLHLIGYPLGWDDTAMQPPARSPLETPFTITYAKDHVLRAALMVNDDAQQSWAEMIRDRAPAGALTSA
ncbi:MAG: NAD(P)/FAD-dependent oxidoreductase [Chloroflexota bacterium]